MRSGDLGHSFSRQLCAFGEIRVSRTWVSPRCLHLRGNVGGFIGRGRGVDKIDEVPIVLLHV